MPLRRILTMTVKGHKMMVMSEPAMRTETVPEWTLGWKLKRALDFADLSAQDMAAELGVHVATVSRWMNDRETPRRAYVMAWSLRCGVPFGWLTGDEGLPGATSSDIRTGIHEESAEQPSTADIQSMMKSIGDLVPLVRPADAARVRGAVR